jgi:hypothetical protein
MGNTWIWNDLGRASCENRHDWHNRMYFVKHQAFDMPLMIEGIVWIG